VFSLVSVQTDTCWGDTNSVSDKLKQTKLLYNNTHLFIAPT